MSPLSLNGWLLMLTLLLVLNGCGLNRVIVAPNLPTTPPATGPAVSTPIAATELPAVPTGAPPSGTAFFREMPAPGPLPGRGGGHLTPPPFPQPGDDALDKGKVYLEQVALEQEQGRLVLYLRGHLPTPCHQLRVQVLPAEHEARVQVRVYSVYDPQTMCVEMLQPFETRIPLDFPPGTLVEVNGEPIETP